MNSIDAFLYSIRKCEGTASPDGYKTLFGGELFETYTDHPNILVEKSGYKSTAAGAYQILYKTWNTVIQPNLNLPDFSPKSQDKAAMFLIANRGALEDVIQGRIEEAVLKCNKEWASLPDSPYGQPTYSMDEFLEFFNEQKGIELAKPKPIEDTDGKPDLTEGITYKTALDLATGAEYESREELRAARSKLSFWDKVRLTWQGKTRVGKIVGTVLDIGELFAPTIAVRTRDLIQSQTNIKEEQDMNWLLNRLTERSTWRGLIVAATGAGVTIAPELQELIIPAGVAVFALVEFFVKEPQSADAI